MDNILAWFQKTLGLMFWLLTISGILILAFVRKKLVVIQVQNLSMVPTLHDGDRVLVWRNWPFSWLRKGQIAIINPSNLPIDKSKSFGISYPFIKRIVGLPTDTFTASISELGELQPYHDLVQYNTQGLRIWDIPENHFFVCGDNRTQSTDSRVWGPLPSHTLLGIAILKLKRLELV